MANQNVEKNLKSDGKEAREEIVKKREQMQKKKRGIYHGWNYALYL